MSADFFRREAIEHHRTASSAAEVLLVLPRGVWLTYRLLLGLLAVATGIVLVASVSRYAEGPAVIRAKDRAAVTASASGTVTSVAVTVGTRVRAGDVLVRYTPNESAEARSASQGLDSVSSRLLDHQVHQSPIRYLVRLRHRGDQAAGSMFEQSVVAPVAGVVNDLRVGPGQAIVPGDFLVSIVAEPLGFSVLAFFPGRQRPELRVGQPLRLEVAGYEQAYQDLLIETVGAELIGQQEVDRLIGPEAFGRVTVTGPVVAVYASTARTTFFSSRREYGYFHGMRATARAQLSSERLFTILVPGIRSPRD